MKKISLLALVGLVACTTITRAAVITVNTADNNDFSAGVTNFVTALLSVGDGDTIAFDIPGAGPHYLQTPVDGFPLLTMDNVTIDGYTQPGSSPNSNPITASNNAVIKIILDSRNGNYRLMAYPLFTLFNSRPPIDNTAMATEQGGYGTNQAAILGIYRATNAKIRGLAFLGDTYTGADPITYMIAVAHDYGLNTNVLDRLAYDQGSSRNCQINGCWFGVDPANQTPAGLTRTFGAIAFFRHRDRLGGTRQELPNESLIVGVKPGSADPRSQFNVIPYMGYGLDGEAIRTRFSGNFLGVMPDGVTPTGIPPFFDRGMQIGRFTDTLPMIFGTDGDGVNDAEEGNLFGPLTDGGVVFEFYGTGSKFLIIAGNRFGIDVNGSRWTNSQTLFSPMNAGTTLRVGSDFDGVSDVLEANLMYNNYPFDDLFPDPVNMLPPLLLRNPNANSHISVRGNTLVNNGLVPFDYADRLGGRLVLFTNFSRAFLDTSSLSGIIPTLFACTQFRLKGNCAPANPASIYTNNLVIDVYVADPEGLANGAKFELPELNVTNGFPQGRIYLGSFQDNGPSDLNPAVGQYEFDIDSFGLAIGTVVTVTANYSADPIGTHNGRVSTSDFSYPVALQAAPSYVLDIPAGYSLIANQLDRGSNTLNEIMPTMPEGSFLFKYDNAVGIYLTASYYNGAWQPGNLALNPGEGAWLYTPTNFSLILTGSPHVPVLPLPACAGYRLLSRQTNDIGTFDNIIGTPPQPNDAVYIWNGASFTFYQFDEFALTWSPSDPTVAVGEAVFIRQSVGPVCAGGPNAPTAPPVITTQPLGQTVSPGANATFSLSASGIGPFTYQWRLNGNNLTGATNASLTINNAQPANSGAYSVVVANVGGATVSQTATLIVITGDLGFVDNFADRILITTAAGVGSGSNTNATREAAEPDHADNPGGKSVWLAWQSPASGIATFSTAGSGFDTLLAVYRGTNLATLKRSASDDDSAGFFASEVKFDAVAGVTYNIAIDGSYGASDHIILNWNLEITTDVIPEIVAQPQDRIVPAGGTFTLLVGAGAGSLPVDYQWFLNDQPVPAATNASLTISNALPADLGIYRVRVSTRPPGVRQVISRPAVVQMSVMQLGDFANVIARDKFLDSSSLGRDLEFLRNGKDGVLNAAPASGFTGTQIFSTYGAAKEPGEPNHCGETGGASYWFAYRTPANGRVSVNTSNSTFNTVLAVYSGADPVTSFAGLTCVACANVAGFGNEVAEFSTTGGRTYYIVVDGVGGVTGTVRLSYDMITARPVVANQPRNVAVTAGNNGTVSVAIASTSVAPLAYQWQFNSVNLPGATQSFYTRPAFQSSQQGNYRVIVTNQAGAVTSSIAMMYLDAPVRSTNSVINVSGFFQSQWSGPIGSLLIVQVSTNLINWSSVSTNTVTAGTISYTDNTPAGATRRYYRTQLAFP